MSARSKFTTLCASLVAAVLPVLAEAQIFTDNDFLSGNYVTNTNVPANATIDFNVDYSNIDRFDGFLTVSIPEAPNTPSGAAATRGVFLTANDDSLNAASGVETFAAIMPTSANVNVGAGTANPNYKVTVDVFHSSAAGFDDGTGGITQTGSTNYSVVGLNQANTTVQIAELNTGGDGTGGLTGQGLALTVTADTGASDDYIPLYGGARYHDRNFDGDEPGQLYNQFSNGDTGSVNTGLLGRHLNDYWESQGLGFEFDDSDGDPTNNLNRVTSNATTYAPNPNDLANYYTIPDGETDPVLTSIVQPLLDAFPENSDPLHYSCGGDNCGLTGDQVLAGNDALFAGVPYNAWSTHELYWVDGEFTYVIDDTPVLQITPDNDGLNGDDNVFSEYSDAGSVLLGFWDRFGGSISINPEGGNFVVYDNLVVEAAATGDAPVVLDYLAANGYLLSTGGNPADLNNDGFVDGLDLGILLGNFNSASTPEMGELNGTDPVDGLDLGILLGAWNPPGSLGATAVPEPTSLALLTLVGACLMSSRNRIR